MTLPIRQFSRRWLEPLRRLSSVSLLVRETHDHKCSEEQVEQDPQESFNSREQSLVALFIHCTTMRDVKQIHACIVRTGFEQHVFVVGRIISFCSVSEQGSIDHALEIFEQLKWSDGFLWNTMIRGFGRTGRVEDAFRYFKRMREAGKPADNFTYCFLLKICGQLELAALGRQLHGCTLKHGLEYHTYVRNTLVHMYGLFKEMDTARRLFDGMPDLDVVSWNTLLDGYVHCGEYEEALRMFHRMQRSGFLADDATFVGVLSACAELGTLDYGRWAHSLISGGSSKLESMASVANSLIDMYAKCGAIDRAHEVFAAMEERNVVSWNSMILGLAMHGHSEEALWLFDQMLENGTEEPNDITFLGVLCACSHGGLVEQGKRLFESMRRDYDISPNIKHYGCMVDLLGRAGFVTVAYELIESMPMEGNAVVWRTLLASCRAHGDVELGEHVRKRLAELEPDHSSDFVLLSHMYAGAGRWKDVLEVRDEMKGRRVEKPNPGNSLINALPSLACYKEEDRYECMHLDNIRR